MSSKFPDTLIFTLITHLDLSKSRVETLAGLIVLLVNVRSVNLTHVAAQFSATAKVASIYRRLQRFFQFARLDEDWLARAVIKLLKINAPWILCLDRTNWKIGKSNVNILMLAVVPRRVRLPLMWTMLGKQGSSNATERIAAMQRYLDIFGSGSIKYILADREFIGPQWIGFLLQNNVLCSIQVKGKMYVTLDNGRTYLLENLLKNRCMWAYSRKHAGRFTTVPGTVGTPLRFACKGLKGGELLISVTNSEKPLEALRIYKRRWFIECMFADSKTRGLDMEDTGIAEHLILIQSRIFLAHGYSGLRPACARAAHRRQSLFAPDCMIIIKVFCYMSDLKKLSLLIAIVAIAIVWSDACASQESGRSSIPKAKHGYLRKSWFTFETGSFMIRTRRRRSGKIYGQNEKPGSNL